MLSVLLILQAGTVQPSLDGVTFDLRAVPKDSADGSIVVTGRRRDYREVFTIPEVEQELALPHAETGLIGKARVGIEAEQQSLAGGAVSNRAMVKVKIPF